MAAKAEVDAVKKALRPKPQPLHLLSTGSTLLNLACSGKAEGGFPAGEYILFVGDSNSGKTFITMACFAEAVRSKFFAGHRLLYNGPEGGALMDRPRLFGPTAAARIEDVCSTTTEEWYDHLDVLQRAKRPFIEVLDSSDALDTLSARKKQAKQRAAREKGEEGKGSYGDNKAKLHSERLRTVVGRLKETGSLLIVINQTRDRIGFGAQFEPKTRSGGWALEFYACVQLWSSIKQRLKIKHHGHNLQTGILSRVRTKRSRLTGKDRTVEFPIYWSTGIDDLGSMVDYLVEWGHWKEANGVVSAREFKMNLPRERLVNRLDEQGVYQDLQMIVEEVWNETEEAVAVHRQCRYR